LRWFSAAFVDDDEIGRGQSVLDDAQTIEFRAE
jgi:hypothetical protein